MNEKNLFLTASYEETIVIIPFLFFKEGMELKWKMQLMEDEGIPMVIILIIRVTLEDFKKIHYQTGFRNKKKILEYDIITMDQKN